MKFEIKKVSSLKRALRVEADGEQFTEKKNKIYRQASKNIKVPGFRPGSAPLEVLERGYSKALRDELIEKLVPELYREAVEQSGLKPVSFPKISGIELTQSGVVFNAEFEVKPELEIKESVYIGVKLGKSDASPEAEEAEIEKIITGAKEAIARSYQKELSDNEIAMWASYPDIDSFRSSIRVQLKAQKLADRRKEIEAKVRQHLIKSVKIELPKAQVEGLHQEMLDRQLGDLAHRGVSQEDIDKHKDDLSQKLKPVAEDEVRFYYILEAIAKQEKLKIDNNILDSVLGFILSRAVHG